VCAPAVAAVASAASGAVGAVGQHQSQMSAYNAQVAATQRSNDQIAKEWAYKLKERDREWNNQLAIWNARKAEYGDTLRENATAAGRAYASEQLRLNEQFNQAAFAKQDMLTQLVGVRGGNLARGQSGRSIAKAVNAVLAAFGRNNAIMAANLASARNNMIRNVDYTREQLNSANMRAWRQVQFAPQPTTAPVTPMLNAMPSKPSNLGLVSGLIGAAASGFNTYSSLKAPSAGDFGGNNQGFGYYSQTQGLGQTSGSFANPFKFNHNYSLPSASKWNITFR